MALSSSQKHRERRGPRKQWENCSPQGHYFRWSGGGGGGAGGGGIFLFTLKCSYTSREHHIVSLPMCSDATQDRVRGLSFVSWNSNKRLFILLRQEKRWQVLPLWTRLQAVALMSLSLYTLKTTNTMCTLTVYISIITSKQLRYNKPQLCIMTIFIHSFVHFHSQLRGCGEQSLSQGFRRKAGMGTSTPQDTHTRKTTIFF